MGGCIVYCHSCRSSAFLPRLFSKSDC